MVDGQKIRLRPWEPSDLTFFGTLRNDVDLQLSLMSLPRPNSLRRVQEWLDRKSGAEDGVFFVIATKEDDRAVGFIEIRGMNPIHGWGWLGIGIAQEARGQGYAKEALARVENYVSRVFGLRKIVLEVIARNVSAIHLYKASGYEQVGIHREHFFHDGRYLDVILMEKHISGKP
jgi:diamine N-acetyltransferase